MASPAANPGGQTPAQKQEKHFGPPVLGKKLFKAKAKALNNNSFRTLPKNIDISTDGKEREKVNSLVKTVLNAPKDFWEYEGAILYDTLIDEAKERVDKNLEYAKKNGTSVETLGDPSGHKIILRGDDKIIVLYTNDIQYQAVLLAKETNSPSPKLFHEFPIQNPPMW